MRGHVRRRHHEEEEESVFVSMTDMTVSFLFIVILLLAFFASQFSADDMVDRDRYEKVVAQRVAALQARDAAKRERDAARADLEATQARLTHVTAERDEALRELEKLRLLVPQLRQAVAERDRTIATLEARVAALEAKIVLLLQENEALRKRFQAENPLERYSGVAADVRRIMLERLAKAVQADIAAQRIEGLTVSAQGDALRFQGSGLFASGARSLSGRSLQIVRLLGEHLDRELPCYAVGPRSAIAKDCNPDLVLFETIQIEGHTDSVGVNAVNLELSAARALSAFTAIAPDRSGEGSEMLGYENLLGQPVLAFAGYGEMRPIVDEATEDRSANRRIDLRFIMYVPPGIEFIPETVRDLERVAQRLRQRAAGQ